MHLGLNIKYSKFINCFFIYKTNKEIRLCKVMTYSCFNIDGKKKYKLF